ncbi:phosphatase PAP2 family protein [Streptomyces sp. NPDC092296]|uniref:phosphatase PAP2 family protein n=1 Tax=Streptomyces sp. NPDC092296 TaxID=3366012 RepID=UPI00380CC366
MSPALRPAVAGALCAAAFTALAVLVAVHRGAPLPGDALAHAWCATHRPAPGVAVARVWTATGNGAVPYLVVSAAGAYAFDGVRRRTAGALGAAGLLLLGQLVRTAVMAAMARPRPPLADWAVPATGSSFPSGHTTTSALAAGLATLALHIGTGGRRATRATGSLLALWAAGVALSRIYLGVHWPSDVLGGWLLAATLLSLLACAATVRTGLTARQEGPPGPRSPG